MTGAVRSINLIVRGQQVKTRTPRRYIVVAVRPEHVHTDAGTYIAFARVEKRTDNPATARRQARCSSDRGPGVVAVVIDAVTGLEI